MASGDAYGRWTGAARMMARTVYAAVAAARAGDPVVFDEAGVALRALDRTQLLTLLGAVTRDLVELAHPDGLDSEDAEQILQSCIRAAAPWYRALDTDSLIRALTGALGIADDGVAEDGRARIDEDAVLTHGVLLIADLLATSALDLPTVLDAAMAELLRAETVELP